MKDNKIFKLLLVGVILFMIWKLYKQTQAVQASIQADDPLVATTYAIQETYLFGAPVTPTTTQTVNEEADVNYADYYQSLTA